MNGDGMEGTGQNEGMRVLVVDDEEVVGRLVARWLQKDGLVVEIARSMEEALERAEQFPVDLVFSDLQMPGGSGLDLARRFKAMDSTIQVIIMTGNTDLEPAIEALRLHADDYLVKPFEPAALLHSARRATDHRRLLLENRSYRMELEDRVRAQARHLEQVYLSGIHSLIRALEAKDPHTRGHSDRVAEFAAALAARIPGVDVEVVRLGAHLHDIGKIGIMSAVLRKPGPLTAEEMEHVRTHPDVGEQILSPMLNERPILDIVRHHHERWDGAGYPDGLAGTNIPLLARIVAVADSYDAMTTERPYRPPRTPGEAVAEIAAEAGRQFDPAVAEAAARAFLGVAEIAS